MGTFLLTLQFLTRLPIPVQVEYTPERLAKGTAFFPLVGLVLGGILCGVYFVLHSFLPPLAMGAILLLAQVLLTGGMHLDGLMDTADGFGSGRPRERMLEIMRDSRVGAMGVIAGCSLLIVKFSFFASLPENPYWILLVMPVLSRFGMAYAIVRFPYARSGEGLGQPFVKYAGRRELAAAFALGAGIAILFAKTTGIALFAVFSLFLFLFCRYLAGKLGGMTGDTYGAVNEVGETVVLLCGILLAN